jgi:LPS export ABC transporter protein LptC
MIRVLVRLVCCALVLAGCKNDLDQVPVVEVAAEEPDRITTGAEYFYSDSGRVRNRLRAGRIREYLGRGRERTAVDQGLELTFFAPNGDSTSVLTAEQGEILPDKHRMVVQEHVVFINERGERLETDRLIWSQDSDRVWTESPVKITRASDVVYGEGLDANEDMSRYVIRRITGQLHVSPGDTLAPEAPR